MQLLSLSRSFNICSDVGWTCLQLLQPPGEEIYPFHYKMIVPHFNLFWFKIYFVWYKYSCSCFSGLSFSWTIFFMPSLSVYLCPAKHGEACGPSVQEVRCWHPLAEHSGSTSSSAAWFHFPNHADLMRERWWLKEFGSCHPCRRPGLNPPAPGVGMSQLWPL